MTTSPEGYKCDDHACVAAHLLLSARPRRGADDIPVYEDRHRTLLLDAASHLELVVVSAKQHLGRGPLGVVATHALMFERQYRRPFDACAIVCGATDPAVEAACTAVGGTMGIPKVVVFATG